MALKRRNVLLVYIVFIILMIFLTFFLVRDLYTEFTKERDEQLRNNSYLLGEWISDSFTSSEYLLMNIINQVPIEDTAYPPSDMSRYYDYKEAIKESMLSFPYAAFSGIIDKDGILSHTTSVDGFDLSGEDFFLEMKNHPGKRTILSNAFKSPEGFYYVIHGLSYEKSDYSFDAMAVIGVSLDFFTEWINKLNYKGSGRISIIDENGILLAHNVEDKKSICSLFEDFCLDKLNTEGPEFQTVSINSDYSPDNKFFAVRKIENRPFYIIIEAEESAFSALSISIIITIISVSFTIILGTAGIRSQLAQIDIHAELERTSSELKTIFDHSLVGIFFLDSGRCIMHANPRFAEIIGFDSPEDANGHDVSELYFTKDDYKNFGKHYLKEFSKGQTIDLEYKFKRKDGEAVWLRTFGKTIDNNIPPDISKGSIWIIDDITERRNVREKLREMATTDPLTGINNRRHFTELGERELAIYERYERPVSVIMFDIDHFKRINDNYGHSIGDKALIHFTEICKENLRGEDIFGRIGGEEFAVVLPVTNIESAFLVAERIRITTGATALPHPEGDILLTVSAGTASVDSKPAKLSETLHQADTALYEAKNSGRNKVIIYSADKTTE